MQNVSYTRLAILIALFIFFIELPVIIGVERFCFHNYDLGIYAQAIRYLNWADWNPWLTGRQLNIFNDHFEPILWVLAPFAKFFRPDRVAVFGELVMVLCSLVPIVYLEKRGMIVKGSSGFFGALILFSRPMVRAMGFPVHPSTWSVFPLSLLAVFVILDKKRWIFAALTLLFLFREEFPFMGLVLGVCYFAMKKRRFGALIFAWSSVWVVLIFILRPMILGPTSGYGVGLIRSFVTHPGAILASYADPTLLRRMFEYLLPMIPLWFWMHREKIRPNAVILSFLISLVSIRFLSVRWYFHYGPPVVAPLVLSCLPVVTSGRQRMIPKWVLGSALVILIAINGGELTRNLGTIFGRGADMCEGGRDRLVSVNRGVDFLSGHIEGRALVGGNLLPALTARSEIYQVGGEQSSDVSQEPYRYVFVEKPPHGDPWPLDRQRIEELIGIWRGMDSAIVHYDDGYVFLAEGRFFTDE